MRIWTVILTILLTWSCRSNNNNINRTVDTETIPVTTTTTSFIDSLEWKIIDEHFQYALSDNISTLADSITMQLESVGILNDHGEFFPIDSISQYNFTNEQLLGVKSIDEIIQNHPRKFIYLKIKTDFMINRRKDLLENIIVNPISELTHEEFNQLLKELNAFDYVETTEIIKQENVLKLNPYDKDSTVFIHLKVNRLNRNVDSLKSKSNQLTRDKRIENAFYNDLLEQARGQYIIIKITNNNG